MRAKSIIPIFFVANVDAAVGYYVDVLGFTESFRYGTYAGLSLHGLELHLTDTGEARQIIGSGTAYVLCDEVDRYCELIRTKGANIKSEPADRVYGLRDFSVLDPDGNQLTFGRDIDGP